MQAKRVQLVLHASVNGSEQGVTARVGKLWKTFSPDAPMWELHRWSMWAQHEVTGKGSLSAPSFVSRSKPSGVLDHR